MLVKANNCKKKMTAAPTLTYGLGGEKKKWTEQSKEFKQQLVGDTLMVCSFLSYSGPFKQLFRGDLISFWQNLMKNIFGC